LRSRPAVRIDRTSRLDYHADPPTSATIFQPFAPSRSPFAGHLMSVRSRISAFSRCIVAGAILMSVAAGCVGPQIQAVRCPIDDKELNKKILEVAPVGTPRDEAVKRLTDAGIRGAFGSEHSGFGKDYYCCQAWRQPNGEVWRISLLLHFDKSGNLCETLDLPDLNPDRPKPAKSSV
jgi:hypothetical protein